MPELTDLDLFLKPEDVVGEIQVTFQDTGRRVSKDETGFEKDSFEITIKLPNGQNRTESCLDDECHKSADGCQETGDKY